ncbi:MAG: hypothetical protein A2Y33_02955 [Spirochaetes bacterium GWF1_51_8]|nr:MAG: hypothetical protein A2Y33_02955 [Spirochaetes bacterium GWF1_51_8]
MNFENNLHLGEEQFQVPHSRKTRPEERLISLNELTALVKPSVTSYSGVQDIEVSKVIGTENRSEYFGEDFLPLLPIMDDRWRKVRSLMLEGKITAPVEAFEYGGYYFIRDGNHRASVAKVEGIEFLSAVVTLMQIPVKLPPAMTRAKIPLFLAKYRFNEETKMFDTLPEELFDIRIPGNWARLKMFIYAGHREWMIKRDGKEPEPATMYIDWNIEIYENTIEEIKRNKLEELFPGMGLTDIFCEIMDYWVTHPGWFADVYDRMVKERKGKNIIQRVKFFWERLIGWLRRTDKEEEARFFGLTRLLFFKPDARIPSGKKHWYRFLTRQLFKEHFQYLRTKFGKEPGMDELARSWYDELFLPACRMYREMQIKEPFPDFYMRWMKEWKKLIRKGKPAGLKESLDSLMPHGGGKVP